MFGGMWAGMGDGGWWRVNSGICTYTTLSVLLPLPLRVIASYRNLLDLGVT